MGLFGGLFDKKVCDLCGGEIGLLGNRKLEDGNCCKQCAAKLSPWFSDRRKSTVQQIREQLEYREENLEEVKAFHTTRTIAADNWNILLDEGARKMILTRNPRGIETENPDVISLSDVSGCSVNIDESVDEIMREVKQGDETKKVSYHPARYSHDYQFDYLINVNNPYFDDMKFRLNRSTVTIEPVIAGTMFDPMLKPEYARYQNIANEITAALTGKGAQAAEEPAAAPRVVICPYCKAETEVGASGRCEYCGGYIAE